MMLALAPWLASLSVILAGPTIGVEPPNLTGGAVQRREVFQREIDQAVAAHGEPAAAGEGQFRLRVSVDESARDYKLQFELLDASGSSIAKHESSCDICAESEAASKTGRELAAFLAEHVDATVTSVRITSAPSGAKVLIDGKEVGTTPYEAEIEPGAHELELRHEGHEPSSRGFEAESGQTREVHVDLATPAKTTRRGPSPEIQRGAWIGGWAGIGVGVALLSTGIALLAIDGNEIESDCSGANVDPFGNCKYRYATTGGGVAATVLGIAFAGAGTGLVLWSRPKDEGGAELKAQLGPTRIGLRLRF